LRGAGLAAKNRIHPRMIFHRSTFPLFAELVLLLAPQTISITVAGAPAFFAINEYSRDEQTKTQFHGSTIFPGSESRGSKVFVCL